MDTGNNKPSFPSFRVFGSSPRVIYLENYQDKDMAQLSNKAKAIRDRIINWQSPTVDDLKNIRAIELIWTQMLETILIYCPDNHEREEAIDCLEILLAWTRKSIIRGNGIDE
jgi:hypothetical protein